MIDIKKMNPLIPKLMHFAGNVIHNVKCVIYPYLHILFWGKDIQLNLENMAKDKSKSLNP